MCKEAQSTLVLDDVAKKKIHECVEACTNAQFGPGGPPRDITFAEIEEFGHQVGRIVARQIDERLVHLHDQQRPEDAPCPTCRADSPPKELRFQRDFQTLDGNIRLLEIVHHCPVCNRDFFPSACAIEDRWPLL